MSDKPNAPAQAAMNQSTSQCGELLVGGMPVSRPAARVGKVPFCAVHRAPLDTGVASLRAVLPAAISLHHAIKANPLPALLQTMAGLVVGLDVASAGEMQVALNAGIPAQDISFSVRGKRDAEPAQAVGASVLLEVESPHEARAVAGISQCLGLPARAALSLNPDFEPRSSGMKMIGGPKLFGAEVDEAPALLHEMCAIDLAFDGFHLYAGSQNLKPEAVVEAQQKSHELACRLAERAPGPVKALNPGGGFGIRYFPGKQWLDVAPVSVNPATITQDAAKRMPQADLIVELERNLVGPRCNPPDLVADRVAFPEPHEDDLIVEYQPGAYGASASPPGFLGRPALVEVLV